MTTTRIQDYLGIGTLAARPATLAINTAAQGLYYATDTQQEFVWNGTTWTTSGGIEINIGGTITPAATISQGTNISFSGTTPNLTLSASGGGGSLTIENQGTSLGSATTLNAGSGITAALSGGIATLTASGGGGGYSPGTPPTVVQVASSTSSSGSAVFGTAPTNGNLLVAMCFNPGSGSANTGWTAQLSNSGGTDFGTIFTKIAGAGESTTQTPCSGASAGATVIWEINGQNATTYFAASLGQIEQSGQTNNTPLTISNATNCLGLSAVSVIPGGTISSALNAGTQDVLTNTGTRYLVAGHTNFGSTPLCGIIANFSATSSSKGLTCLISH